MSAEPSEVVGVAETDFPDVESDEVMEGEGRLLDFVRKLSDLGSAELLRDWHSWMNANLDSYANEAVRLCGEFRPRHMGTVRATMSAWLDQQRELFVAVEKRVAELRRLTRHRVPPPPPDAAQPGDVRAVYGETQVHLDGRWFALGPERAP